MADTEDVAQVLTDFVLSDPNMPYLTSSDRNVIRERMECIVIEWYIDYLDAKKFVKRMKSLEDCN